ncbi:hypothetical protein FGA82_00320 [Pseudomonas fluorescens]|nr:hypothetical protein FGA82_00320 [Pseudomonas fluorescens]
MAVEYLIKIESHARSREGGIGPGRHSKPYAIHVGASLLAKASDQPASMLNDTPLSRASSLPQGLVVFNDRADKRPTVGFHTDRVGIVYSEKVGTCLPQP